MTISIYGKDEPARCMKEPNYKCYSYYAISDPRHSIYNFIQKAEVRFRPKTVNIKVIGFACDGSGVGGGSAIPECRMRCTQNVAEAVLYVFNRSKLERASYTRTSGQM